MSTCKTCTHWSAPVDRVLRDGYGECNADVFREDGRSWYNRDDDGLITTPKTETDRVCYSYDEGGWFQTGPDFGCVHHKAKE
jgi:hypothetical protein